MKIHHLALLLCAAFLASCHRREASEASLSCIDRQLERHQQWEPIELDSAFTEAVVDIEHNGTPNQRLLAYYLLGYAYYEHGQIEDAQKAYLQAIASADTTAADCDFSQLAKTYNQKAALYSKQANMQLCLNDLDKVDKYARLAQDTIMIINVYGQRALAYQRMKKYDEALRMYQTAFDSYLLHGDTIWAADVARSIAYYQTSNRNIENAAYYLSVFEQYNTNADTLIDCNRHYDYYYIKGWYFQNQSMNDSALIYYRRALHCPQIEAKAQSCVYLSNLYGDLGVNDSALFYSNYYSNYTDSLNRMYQHENLQRTQIHYNNKLLNTHSKENSRTSLWYIILFLLACSLILFDGVRHILKRLHAKQGHTCEQEAQAEEDPLQAWERIKKETQQTDLYAQLMARCSSLSPATELIRNEVDEYIRKKFPEQHALFISKGIRDNARFACELALLGIISKKISILIGLTEQGVSNIWNRQSMVLFKKEYNKTDLLKYLLYYPASPKEHPQTTDGELDTPYV